jgi:hypothetical protein
MSRLPCQKGTSVLPVVQALRQRPEARALLPEALWKYLDEPVLISGWYPERDYWILIAALVKTMDPAAVGGDPWRYFAKFSAQRDIGGQAQAATSEAHPGATGVYRNFANMTDPASLFSAATRLWKQYHDTGRMEVVSGRRESNSVFVRLIGFVIPIDGFVRLQGYYLEEYGRLVGIDLVSTVTRNTARKDPFCEWEYLLARTPEAEAYVASLPAQLP